jgi:SpoVK/Ycf46/Vps4 family AAA+-type ATPase
MDIEALARPLKGMVHADIERICLDAVKTCILENKQKLDRLAFQTAVSQQRERLHIRAAAFKKNGK